MSAIVQELGFDASEAIKTLRQLDAAMKAVEGRATSMSGAFGKLNSAVAPTPAALASIAQGTAGLGTSLGNVASKATAAGKALPAIASPQVQSQFAATVRQSERLTTSIGLLSRIVFTQTVIKGLRLIEQNLVSAGKSAAAFQKQLAEINNLSDQFTPDKAGVGIRAISDKFSIGLPETGKALADIVGNQIGKNPEEQLAFLEEAAALAKSGVATLDSSAQLLSSITNSYGKDVAEVGRVSSILFKTTDLGSVTVEQLAGSMGRVLPQAKLLGVSLEEVAAGFSTLTRFGTNAPESATQLAGSFSALIKPSNAMKEAFETLGVSGGEALIAMKGYQGALQAVIGTTDGSSRAIGKLFPNVRGLNAALKLGSQQASAYASDLKEIQGVTSSLSRDKAANVTGTEGQRLAAEAQKLKNALTIDFGQSVLRTGVQLSDFVGGANNVIKVMEAIGPAAIGAGAGVGILTARTRLGVAEGTALYGVLGKVAGGLTAVGAAASAGNFIGNKIADNLFGDFRKRVEENISALQRFRDAQQNFIAESQANNTDRIRSALASGEEVDLERLSKIVNRPVTKDNQAGALTEARDRLTAFQQIVAAADNAQKKISQLRGEIRAADTASAGTLGTLGKLFSGPNAGPALNSIESIRNEILKLSQSGEVSEEQISSLAKRVEKVKEFAGKMPATKLGFATEAASLDGALSRLKQIRELQKSVPGEDRARQQAQEIQSFFSDLPIASFNQMQAAIGGAVEPSASIAENLRRAAADAERAANAMPQFGSEEPQFGGKEPQFGSEEPEPAGDLLQPEPHFNITAPKEELDAIEASFNEAESAAKILEGDVNSLGGDLNSAANSADALDKGLNSAANSAGESASFVAKMIALMLNAVNEMGKSNLNLFKLNEASLQLNEAFGQGGGEDVASFDQMESALGSGVGSSAGIATNLERAAAAAQRAAAAAASLGGEGDVEGFALGGLIRPRYFAEGGPVGSDRVPAWLSPGEMVMNRGATSRFFSQLSAMNSGARPSAVTRVGDSTNVTFNGGINVTGGPTNEATGRAIIQTIKRETRRGSARL